MRFFGFFLAAIMLFSLFSSASAAIAGFPSEIELFGEPKQISFIAVNPSDSTQRLSVRLFAPIDLNVSAPVFVDGKKEVNVSITLFPKKEFTGQEYKTTLIVAFGSDETRQQTRIIFKQASQNNNAADANIFGLTGIASFFSNKNLEFALNMVLAIIAIILLIAFIARLVKRFSVEK